MELNEMNNIVISSEDKLFKILEDYIETGLISDNMNLQTTSTGIRLVGEKFEQSLTPNIMKGFVEMQKLH